MNQPASAPGRILVVEDDRMVRRALVEWLGIAGHTTSEAENASAALGMLEAEQPDLVLSDVRMPGLSGLELLERLQALDPDLPVVLITGHGDVPLAVSAMRLGAHDFITKPYDPDHLAAIIARALAHQQLRRELKNLREASGGSDACTTRLIGSSRVMEGLRQQAR